MTDSQSNNKRIAKNTLLLYMRMMLLMALSLYTSRINLDSLGEVDYGVYNVVGGVVAMFSIISGSVTVAISRYLTYEIGVDNKKRLNTIFCTSINIQILMSVVIFIVAEIVGVWFLNNKMNIPIDRIEAANWVLQCSIFTFLLNLISVPYNALIIAHEKMSAFAYISILEAILKLIVCYLLYISPVDKLITWAVMLMIVSLCMRIVYGIYASRHFEESQYRFIMDKALMKEMSRFIGFAFLGNGVVVLRDQGTNILLNIFCGPIVNAARGIAMNVNAAMFGFVTNFMTALNPQITKNYARQDYENMNKLIIRGCRFGFFIMMLLVIPIAVNINYILNLWLIDVPAYTAAFVVLTLLYSLIDCFCSPLMTGILANGNIKKYEIQLTVIYIVNFIIIYTILGMGSSPEWVFALAILFKGFVVIALIWNGKNMYYLRPRLFLYKAIFKPILICIICFSFALWLKIDFGHTFVNFLFSAGVSFFFSLGLVWLVGLESTERCEIMKVIKNKIHI